MKRTSSIWPLTLQAIRRGTGRNIRATNKALNRLASRLSVWARLTYEGTEHRWTGRQGHPPQRKERHEKSGRDPKSPPLVSIFNELWTLRAVSDLGVWILWIDADHLNDEVEKRAVDTQFAVVLPHVSYDVDRDHRSDDNE